MPPRGKDGGYSTQVTHNPTCEPQGGAEAPIRARIHTSCRRTCVESARDVTTSSARCQGLKSTSFSGPSTSFLPPSRHSREGGNPVVWSQPPPTNRRNPAHAWVCIGPTSFPRPSMSFPCPSRPSRHSRAGGNPEVCGQPPPVNRQNPAHCWVCTGYPISDILTTYRWRDRIVV